MMAMEIDLLGKKVNCLLNGAPANQLKRRESRIGSGPRPNFAEIVRRKGITQAAREDFHRTHRYDRTPHRSKQQARASGRLFRVLRFRPASTEAKAIHEFR